jgi:hypothetical protein
MKALEAFRNGASKRLTLCGMILLSFVTGSVTTAGLIHANQVKAASDRVFELMIYHTIPGKVPELEAIFREVSKLQDKHDMKVVGYWVPNEDPAWKNTFIYVIAHPSREVAEKNWMALHADPSFPAYRKAAEPLIEKANGEYNVDAIYMRPTDFSALK